MRPLPWPVIWVITRLPETSASPDQLVFSNPGHKVLQLFTANTEPVKHPIMSDDEHWDVDAAIAEDSGEETDASAIDIDTIDVEDLEDNDEDTQDGTFVPENSASSEDISSDEDDDDNKNPPKSTTQLKSNSSKSESNTELSDSDDTENEEPEKNKKKHRARTASECIDREVFKYPNAPQENSNHAVLPTSPDLPISIWNWKEKKLQQLPHAIVIRDGIVIPAHKPKTERKKVLPKIVIPDEFDTSDTTWIVSCNKSKDEWKTTIYCTVKIEGLEGYYPLKDVQELSLLRPVLKKSGVKGLSLASVVEIKNDPLLCPGKIASLFSKATIPEELQQSGNKKSILLIVSSNLAEYSAITTSKRKENAAAKKQQKKQKETPAVTKSLVVPKKEKETKHKSTKRKAEDEDEESQVTKKEKIQPQITSTSLPRPTVLPKPIQVTSLLPAVEKKLDREMRGEGVIKITASFTSLSQASAFIETARIHGVYTENK